MRAEHIERSEPDLRQSLEPLWERLRDTIAWCQANVDVASPMHSLRSDVIRPRTLEDGYYSTVGAVASHRRRACWKAVEGIPARSLEGGRLLVHFPDLDLACGAAQAASRGFFDVHNVPPWGTWVAMIQETEERRGPYLLSWVPPQFLALAERGIDVNPECCITWLAGAQLRLEAYANV